LCRGKNLAQLSQQQQRLIVSLLADLHGPGAKIAVDFRQRFLHAGQQHGLELLHADLFLLAIKNLREAAALPQSFETLSEVKTAHRP
jgi:hypothetical protein